MSMLHRFSVLSLLLLATVSMGTSGCDEAQNDDCLSFKDISFAKYALNNWDVNDDFCIDSDEAMRITDKDVEGLPVINKSLDDLDQFPNVVSLHSRGGWYCELTSVDLSYIQNVSRQFFQGCTDLTSANLPNVTKIEDNTFAGCYNLASVSLPKVKIIGDGAFDECQSLTSIALPEATEIGGSAFEETSELKTVSLPKVKTVGMSAFTWSGITEIDLPNARTIQDWAFHNCTSLTHAKLPKVTRLGEGVFTSDVPLQTLELTTSEDISLDDTFVEFIDYYRDYLGLNTSRVNLVLHRNKAEGGKGKPNVEDGEYWAGHRWKSIRFVD